MAYRMNARGDRLRCGFDKNGNLHLEVWPVSFGWRRDTDPAISSTDPHEIDLPAEVLPYLSRLCGHVMPNNFQSRFFPIREADTAEGNRFLVADELGAFFAVARFDGEDWVADGTVTDLGVEAKLDFEPVWQIFMGAVLNKFPPCAE